MRTFKVVGKFFVNKGKDELRKAEQYVVNSLLKKLLIKRVVKEI